MDSTLYNNPRESIKNYSEITDVFTEIIDLGTAQIYRGLILLSTLDEDVKIQFTNSEQSNPELTVQANSMLVLDNFRHNNVIKIKYISTAPASGGLQMVSWRAE